MTVREQLVHLLKTAAMTRATEAERVALESASLKAAEGDDLGEIARTLPHLRHAKGLVMAISWAAELEETGYRDPDWYAECLSEFDRAVSHYEKVLPTT